MLELAGNKALYVPTVYLYDKSSHNVRVDVQRD